MATSAQPADSSPEEIPAEIRRQRIAAALDELEFVRVSELSERFHTSTVTIRNDLDQLMRRGLVRRVHGGAVKAGPLLERTFEETAESHAVEKRLIAREAADLVSSGDTLILDVGTTTTAIARELLARVEQLRDVVVFTSALNIAVLLEPAIPHFTVVVTGGTLRPLQHSLVDPLAGLVLDRVHVRLAFLGCNGVEARRGVTNVNLPEAEIKRRMLSVADRRIVVADGSKFGDVAVAHLCDVAEVDLFITDGSADAAELAALREAGAEVRVAGDAGADGLHAAADAG
jgi:DeoR family transcriptional regulator, aga operon transcriptional repressor